MPAVPLAVQRSLHTSSLVIASICLHLHVSICIYILGCDAVLFLLATLSSAGTCTLACVVVVSWAPQTGCVRSVHVSRCAAQVDTSVEQAARLHSLSLPLRRRDWKALQHATPSEHTDKKSRGRLSSPWLASYLPAFFSDATVPIKPGVHVSVHVRACICISSYSALL